MLELEFKILLLTMVYFAGWFIFEKVFSAAWERWTAQPSTGSRPANRTRVPTLASVTPLDQTFRYIRGLKNPDWRVRRISCIQLGDKRGTAVVQALIAALADPKEEVSMAAGEALAKIGDPAAINALQEHLQKLDSRLDGTWEQYRAA
ncbi:MAG TPA: HEAT repeat domain-containing protein [Candidatus Ozemobacteraceae bacterium]|nr:HEAT repeat domain-containing protein [Candidatus Ozemobacteraceae bacterium]HQG28741.1 HEAT repeat domain-containing protein [Candidatus Ozemobacteraceae bacterium]